MNGPTTNRRAAEHAGLGAPPDTVPAGAAVERVLHPAASAPAKRRRGTSGSSSKPSGSSPGAPSLDPATTFKRWYGEPLAKLRRIPNGDGAFIALATACFLYERYASTLLNSQNVKVDTKAIIRQLRNDFGLSSRKLAADFWDVIRDGLAHAAMPTQSGQGKQYPPWAFSESYPSAIQYDTAADGERILGIQPWSFVDRVLELWGANLGLLAQSNAFPWATIVEGFVPAEPSPSGQESA